MHKFITNVGSICRTQPNEVQVIRQQLVMQTRPNHSVDKMFVGRRSCVSCIFYCLNWRFWVDETPLSHYDLLWFMRFFFTPNGCSLNNTPLSVRLVCPWKRINWSQRCWYKCSDDSSQTPVLLIWLDTTRVILCKVSYVVPGNGNFRSGVNIANSYRTSKTSFDSF